MVNWQKTWARIIPLVSCAVAFGLCVATIISYDWVINAVKDSTRNPEEVFGGDYKYLVERLGGWLACFREVISLNGTCTMINLSCASKPCWLHRDGTRLCGNETVKLISNCAAFNAVRFLLVFGTLFETAALILHFAWIFEDRSVFGFSAGSVGLFGAILNLCSYVVCQVVFVGQSGLTDSSDLGWGFYTLLLCWIPGLLAGVYTIILAFLRNRPEDDWANDDRNRLKRRFAQQAQYYGDDYN